MLTIRAYIKTFYYKQYAKQLWKHSSQRQWEVLDHRAGEMCDVLWTITSFVLNGSLLKGAPHLCTCRTSRLQTSSRPVESCKRVLIPGFLQRQVTYTYFLDEQVLDHMLVLIGETNLNEKMLCSCPYFFSLFNDMSFCRWTPNIWFHILWAD